MVRAWQTLTNFSDNYNQACVSPGRSVLDSSLSSRIEYVIIIAVPMGMLLRRSPAKLTGAITIIDANHWQFPSGIKNVRPWIT